MDIERLKELKDYLRVANELSILNDDNLMQRIVDNNDVTDTIDIAIELLNAEISRQSATSEEVAEAIEWVTNTRHRNQYMSGDWTAPMGSHINRTIQDTIITALQSYQPKPEPTSEEVQDAIDFMENELEIIESFTSKYEFFSKNISIFKTILAALQAYQPWIPVSNVKPEKSGRYVAYVPEHWTAEVHKEGKVIIAYFRELNYEGKRRTWDDGAYGISGEVTHYLPLPEPPKGE
jgi:hypothetical protein